MGHTTLQRKYYSKVGSGPHKHTARRAVHSAVEVVKVGVVLQCNVNRSYRSAPKKIKFRFSTSYYGGTKLKYNVFSPPNYVVANFKLLVFEE